jgi:coiled-coil domain-containing protein 55
MAHFYRKLLEDSESKHEATVAATQKPTIGPQGSAPNLTISKPPELQPKSDLDLANAAKEKGIDVELNDDNQIVDKRELLSAGLNLSGANTRKLGLARSTKESNISEESVQAHRAVGTAASRKEINERRNCEIRQQMAEEERRQEQEKEQQEKDATQRAVLKRNNETDVQSARERYLERKRRKLEEQTQVGEAS